MDADRLQGYAATLASRRMVQCMCVLVGLLYTAGFTAATTQSNQQLEVAEYQRIHLLGNARLLLVQNHEAIAATTDVTVSGTPQSLQELHIESSDGVLYIDAGNTEHSAEVLISLTVNQLEELFSEGSSSVAATSLSGDRLTIESHGGGHIDIAHLEVGDLTVVGAGMASVSLAGAVEHQYVDLQGQGVYDAHGLASRTSQVSVSGSSQVELWVEELLDVSVFGDAIVRYSGRPWVRQHMFGKGAIYRASQ